MLKISYAQLFFKCCHKIDPNTRGYMFNGNYIESISAHCWHLLHTYLKDKSSKNKYNLIELFCDIKRKNKYKWQYFITPVKVPKVPYRNDFSFSLSKNVPDQPYIGYNLFDTIIYEKWTKN